MIKVLADKHLAFDRGEKDKHGTLIQVKTVIGFNELPDWVEKNDYFKAAVEEGSLKPFNSSNQSEDVQKSMEKRQALLDEIKALEEKRDLLKGEPLGDSDNFPAKNDGVGTTNKKSKK